MVILQASKSVLYKLLSELKKNSPSSKTLKLKKNKGFSLIEVLVALGLLSLVSAGVANLILEQRKHTNIFESTAEATSVRMEIESYLQDPVACQNTLEDKDPFEDHRYNRRVREVRDRYGNAQIRTHTAIRNGLLKINHIEINPDGLPEAPNAKGMVELQVVMSGLKINHLPEELRRKHYTIPVQVELGGDKRIRTCKYGILNAGVDCTGGQVLTGINLDGTAVCEDPLPNNSCSQSHHVVIGITPSGTVTCGAPDKRKCGGNKVLVGFNTHGAQICKTKANGACSNGYVVGGFSPNGDKACVKSARNQACGTGYAVYGYLTNGDKRCRKLTETGGCSGDYVLQRINSDRSLACVSKRFAVSCTGNKRLQGFDTSGNAVCASPVRDTRASGSCGSGYVMRGIAANGRPNCVRAVSFRDQTCPQGQSMVGLTGDGSIRCRVDEGKACHGRVYANSRGGECHLHTRAYQGTSGICKQVYSGSTCRYVGSPPMYKCYGGSSSGGGNCKYRCGSNGQWERVSNGCLPFN